MVKHGYKGWLENEVRYPKFDYAQGGNETQDWLEIDAVSFCVAVSSQPPETVGPTTDPYTHTHAHMVHVGIGVMSFRYHVLLSHSVHECGFSYQNMARWLYVSA
jgi:hypothetical protein